MKHKWARSLLQWLAAHKLYTVRCVTSNAMINNPREVFRKAIGRKAKVVIVCHNHPAGCPEPSDEDLRITKPLRQTKDIIGIEFLTHVIVTRHGYISLREAGELE